jgi:hypothetical protein
MFRKTFIAPLLAASAMALTVSPAHAGKADRARQAIAAAEAKIHTADGMGTGANTPVETARAHEALANAKEQLERGDKSEAIETAIHASAMADTAIGVLQHDKDQQIADANAARQSDVTVAQQQAADAQQQAVQANARADMAQQQAASSAAEASAARSAAIAAQNQPAQVETTVTTQQAASTGVRHTRRPATRRVTTKRTVSAAPAQTTTTTTTVRQAVNN